MLGRAAGRWCRRAATKAAAAVEISVDRSELGVLAPPFQGTFATPLQEEIHRFISVFGPISVAEYMRRALLHPKLGYYTTGSTPFGSAGDFVTSPEVSQLFGEMVGVWATAVWHGLGSPRDTRLVEFGPGNGTMMCDVLKTVKRLGFKPSGIHLIEPSPMLREKQKAVLSVQHADVPVQWDSQLANVETGDTCPIFFAHEFLDALPIHQFQFTEKGWRERMLAIGEHEALQVVLSRKPTPASALLLGSDAVVDVPANPAVGECIEVSPEVQLAVEQISSRVVMQKGAALLVDYGQDRPSRQSVRGVRNHEFVPFLESPGQVDVTGDVDFSMVRKVARVWGADQIRVMPTIQQGDFLLRMGIAQRVESLVKLCPDDADTIITGYERLVDPEQMGSIYKCSAMVHASFNGEFPGFPTPS
ncbi:Protein arginine methyltransferase NDUFAF7 [Plasmodiophora brassicae]